MYRHIKICGTIGKRTEEDDDECEADATRRAEGSHYTCKYI